MRMLVALFVTLGIVFVADATACYNTADNPCKCISDQIDGKNYTIDISFLQGKTAKQSGQTYTYDMFPCKMQVCEREKGDEKYAVCQVPTSGEGFGCGKSDVEHTTWEITDFANKIFAITFKGGNSDRESDFIFTYGSGETTYEVTSSEKKKYRIEVKGKDVDIKPVGGGGGGFGAGEVGWILMALILVAVLMYFIIGALIMYFVKGARGVEVVPQYSFWKDLPLLIKDGFLFTISPCYKGASTHYEKI